MDALAGAGKLGALLLQFPWSFKNTDEERVYLTKLLERFREYPLVVGSPAFVLEQPTDLSVARRGGSGNLQCRSAAV